MVPLRENSVVGVLWIGWIQPGSVPGARAPHFERASLDWLTRNIDVKHVMPFPRRLPMDYKFAKREVLDIPQL